MESNAIYAPIANRNQERKNGPTYSHDFLQWHFSTNVLHINHNAEHDMSDRFLIYFPKKGV